MQLAEVLDVVEGLLVASEHPDIVSVKRYGTATGPSADRSRTSSISGVRVTYSSTATAVIWGAIWPGETPIPTPGEMPPPVERTGRLAIFVVQLLDVARPQQFRSWQLVALPDLGPTAARGTAASGVSVVCADGTKMLLRTSSTGATVGAEPTEEPFPDYVIPEGVKSWHLKVNAQSAAHG
jgi:hypothetical protein